MVGIHESILTNVLFAVGISNLAIEFPHLFVGGLNEFAIIVFTEVWNFGIQVNSESLVRLKILPSRFNLPTKIPMELLDQIG